MSAVEHENEIRAARPGRDRWRWARVLLITLAVIAVISQWARTLLRPQGDFTLHWRFGQRFLACEYLYANGMHKPYPPCWAMAASVLTVLPMATMRALLYPLGPMLVVVLLNRLDRMTRAALPLVGKQGFWTVALTLVLSSRFLIRELPECGANLMVVTLAWLGLYFWTRQREGLGGTCLGAAIALKCTPGLFLIYFGWKRQWRMVGVTALAAACFTIAPLLWMGPWDYGRHMAIWGGRVWQSAVEPHPLKSMIGDVIPHNIALKPALGRLLVRLGPEHEGYCDHPWHVDLLDTDPVVAGRIISVLMLGLLVGFGMIVGRRVEDRTSMATLWECAAVMILMLLYSPITWRQHGVAILPAAYLISRSVISRGALPRGMMGGLGVFVFFVLLLDRGVIGRELTLLLDSYGVTAWSLLALLWVTLVGRGHATRAETRPAQDGSRVLRFDPREQSGSVGSRKPAHASPWVVLERSRSRADKARG